MLDFFVFLIALLSWSVSVILSWPEKAIQGDRVNYVEWYRLKHQNPKFAKLIMIGKLLTILSVIISAFLLYLNWKLFLVGIIVIFFPITRNILINVTVAILKPLLIK